MPETCMTSIEVIDFYSTLESLGMMMWVDGGWGVDALLGEQTRPHKDLDIAMQQQDVPTLRAFLESRGYREIKLEEAHPWNFVFGDDKGHEIDVHVIVFDEQGNGLYGPVERGMMYPAASLTGSGVIDGYPVKCISPEWLIQWHRGYELQEKDFQDVAALCKKFGIVLPEEFAQ